MTDQGQPKNSLKLHRLLQLICRLMLVTLFLTACTFSVEVLSTPTSPAPAATGTPHLSTATPTLVPFTLIPASVTPTLIPIRGDTLPMLEIFLNVSDGGATRAVAFTPDSAVLASASDND